MEIVNLFCCGCGDPSFDLEMSRDIGRLLGRDLHVLDGRLLELRDGKLVPGPDFCRDITAFDGTDVFENGLPYIRPALDRRGKVKGFLCFFPHGGQWCRTHIFETRAYALAAAAHFVLTNKSVLT